MNMGRKLIDVSGNVYGKFTVIKYDKEKSTPKKHYWVCRCECGNIKSVNIDNLKNGSIKACGCLKGQNSKKYLIQNKKLYKKWQHMKSRCLNKNDISYKNYGARGIKVCDEWLNYNNFANWSLNNGFDEKLELDRINVNGNYEPSNCRYVCRLINSRNKRDSKKYLYNGKIMSLKEIAISNNIEYKTLWKRLHSKDFQYKYGMDIVEV
jgi:hypothetical protein